MRRVKYSQPRGTRPSRWEIMYASGCPGHLSGQNLTGLSGSELTGEHIGSKEVRTLTPNSAHLDNGRLTRSTLGCRSNVVRRRMPNSRNKCHPRGHSRGLP